MVITSQADRRSRSRRSWLVCLAALAVSLMSHAQSVSAPQQNAPPASQPARSPLHRPIPKPVADDPNTVTDEQVGQAIQRAANYLYAPMWPADRPERYTDASGDLSHDAAVDCLAVYALLQAGMAVRDPRLDPRHDPAKWMIDGMKQYDMHGRFQTYARGIRATALALYNRPEDRDTLRADAYWLICVCDGGAYTYTYPDPPGLVTPVLARRTAAPPNLSDSVSRILGSGSAAGDDREEASTQPDYSKPKKEATQDSAALIVSSKTFNVDPHGMWDNSNSQYGVLGVWSAAEAGIEVPRSYWIAVDRNWADWQEVDGHWMYSRGYDCVNIDSNKAELAQISMTCAGLATSMVTYEYLDTAANSQRGGRMPFSIAVEKGLAWLEKDDHSMPGEPPTYYIGGYGFYGLERVGLACGFKHFGTHDWYKQGARILIDQQDPDGHWVRGERTVRDAVVKHETPSRANIIDTAYCLLFLARGRHPILMAKLRFDGVLPASALPGLDMPQGVKVAVNAKPSDMWMGYWNNRPRDAANLARFASTKLERQFNWETLNIDRDWDQWLDAPVLELASHTAPQFTDAQIEKLRNYILAGGLLFTHADGGSPLFNKYAAHLAHQLFPQYELTDVPSGHPLYTNDTTYNVSPRPPLKMLSNGSRILMLHSPTDITRWWQQRDDVRHRAEFELGVNMFVYAAGKQDYRNRLQQNWVSQPPAKPLDTFKLARVTYAGNWSPEPWAWLCYGNWLQKHTGTCIETYAVPVSQLRTLDPAQVPLAHLTGTARQDFTADDAAQVRAYVQGGGVLLVDMCGGMGSFNRSAEALLAAAFPDQKLQPMPLGHPLLKKGNLGTEDVTRPLMRAETVKRYGKGVGSLSYIASGKGHVIYTPLDITSGVLGIPTLGILGYEPVYAEAMVKNIIFWTLDGQHDR